jgi:hypothetical protein
VTYEVQPKQCADPTCEASYKPHAWGSIHAHAAGWFQQKDGTAWCPQHNPPWVAEWRARQQKERAK